MESEKKLSLRKRKGTQRNMREPTASKRSLPRVVPLGSLPPISVFRNHIGDLFPKPYLLHAQPLSAIRRQSRFQRIEDRRVIIESVGESPQKDRVVEVRFSFGDGDDCGIERLDLAEEGSEVAAVAVGVSEKAVEVENAVDGERLVGKKSESRREEEVVGVVAVEEKKRTELKAETERASEGQEAVAGAGERVEIGAGGGDAEHGGRREKRTVGEGLHKGRPLDAVHDVEVEDVDGLVGLIDGFEDGLVGSEVSEADKRGNLVEGEIAGVKSPNIHTYRRRIQTEEEGSRELVSQSLRRIASRRRPA